MHRPPTTNYPAPSKEENDSSEGANAQAVYWLTPEQEACKSLPWYRRGGMHVNMFGHALNIFVPVIVLASYIDNQLYLSAFLALLVGAYVTSFLVLRCKTTYCIVVVPTFMISLLLSLSLQQQGTLIPLSIVALALSLGLAIVKVNICMSVCLHRYAAHTAFKVHSAITQFFLAILGCLANQGGPIWWASQHRCHHRYCDIDRDPHSPIQMGTEAAFGFFEKHQQVDEKFAPKHLESKWMRVLDTWSFVWVSLELYLGYLLFGPFGLFIAYTSGWMCQSVTLWFNVANHPADKAGTCKASNRRAAHFFSYYLPYHFLNVLHDIIGIFVAEDEHEHHHHHPNLAKRSKYDLSYWGFIYPLERAGIVSHVKK